MWLRSFPRAGLQKCGSKKGPQWIYVTSSGGRTVRRGRWWARKIFEITSKIGETVYGYFWFLNFIIVLQIKFQFGINFLLTSFPKSAETPLFFLTPLPHYLCVHHWLRAPFMSIKHFLAKLSFGFSLFSLAKAHLWNSASFLRNSTLKYTVLRAKFKGQSFIKMDLCKKE